MAARKAPHIHIDRYGRAFDAAGEPLGAMHVEDAARIALGREPDSVEADQRVPLWMALFIALMLVTALLAMGGLLLVVAVEFWKIVNRAVLGA